MKLNKRRKIALPEKSCMKLRRQPGMLFKKVSYLTFTVLNRSPVLSVKLSLFLDLLWLDPLIFLILFFIYFFLGGKYSEKGKAKTIDVAQPSIPLPPPINNTNYDDTPMDLSFPSTVISNENTQTQVNKCKQPGMVDSLGMFLPSKNMLVPSSPPDFISSKPMMVFGKTFPKYDRFPLDAMHCQLDANNLHMGLCAYAFPRAGYKSQADMKEGIPVNGTAPRLIFYNDRNAFNLNMDSKYIKRLIQFGLLFLSGNPHLPQDEQDMADIFTENPELEYPWNDMWELFENFKKLKVQSPTLNDGYSSADADLSLHENESEDGEDVLNEKGNGSQDNELLSGSIEHSEFDFSDDEN